MSSDVAVHVEPKAPTADAPCHRESEVRATLKLSPNFSLTLTRELTWAGKPPHRYRVSETRRFGHVWSAGVASG
jgi:hypothetical protein